jgi:hypothetical protein
MMKSNLEMLSYLASKRMRAICMYACKAEAVEELSFSEGDVINKVVPDVEAGLNSSQSTLVC